MFEKCCHVWEVQVNKELPAPAELVTEISGCGQSFFEKTSIVIMTCKKCGKIDKTITKG